jgi:Ca-activated chloride channel family protein
MTNLGGGFDVGVQQLTGAGERQAIQRVILVSDGLANVGVTAPAALNGKAAAARQARVGVSTMGVGQRFNELLLQSLAEYGGGRYHYIKDAHALLPIFRQEIAGVQGTVATSVQITVAGCAGCQVVEAPGYALQRQGGQTHIVISDLAGGQRRKALVKVRLPRDRPGKRELAVRLAYHTARGARRAMSHREKVAFRITADRQKVRATLDKRIADRVAQVQASKDVNKAMKAYQFGNAAVAGNLLSGAAKRLERVHRATGSKRAQRRARQLRQAARKVRSRPSPASAPSRHLMKKMRYDAAESTRR